MKKTISLLEVIICIGILSIGIATTLRSIIFSIKISKTIKDLYVITKIAKDEIEEFEFKESTAQIYPQKSTTNETDYIIEKNIIWDDTFKLFVLNYNIKKAHQLENQLLLNLNMFLKHEDKSK